MCEKQHEIDSLKAEIERLREEAALWKSRVDEACAVLERRELAFDRAQDEIERLRERVAALQASSGYEASIAQVEIERLRAALQSLTKDPPAFLAREPDTDAEVIIKMRKIARAALGDQSTPWPTAH